MSKESIKTLTGFVIIGVIVFLLIKFTMPSMMYLDAKSELKEGNYSSAKEKFFEVRGFLNSRDLYYEASYKEALVYSDKENYQESWKVFQTMRLMARNSDYELSQEMKDFYKDVSYKAGEKYKDSKGGSYFYYEDIRDYLDSNELYIAEGYKAAIEYYNNGETHMAQPLFEDFSDYRDSTKYLEKIQERGQINYVLQQTFWSLDWDAKKKLDFLPTDIVGSSINIDQSILDGINPRLIGSTSSGRLKEAFRGHIKLTFTNQNTVEVVSEYYEIDEVIAKFTVPYKFYKDNTLIVGNYKVEVSEEQLKFTSRIDGSVVYLKHIIFKSN